MKTFCRARIPKAGCAPTEVDNMYIIVTPDNGNRKPIQFIRTKS